MYLSGHLRPDPLHGSCAYAKCSGDLPNANVALRESLPDRRLFLRANSRPAERLVYRSLKPSTDPLILELAGRQHETSRSPGSTPHSLDIIEIATP
jgi:hypothetical protein